MLWWVKFWANLHHWYSNRSENGCFKAAVNMSKRARLYWVRMQSVVSSKVTSTPRAKDIIDWLNFSISEGKFAKPANASKMSSRDL